MFGWYAVGASADLAFRKRRRRMKQRAKMVRVSKARPARRRRQKTVRVVVDYDAFPTVAAAERAAKAAAQRKAGYRRSTATVTRRR
jgi:hypothetical protein